MKFMDHMDVLNEPPDKWVRRLVQDCPVYLVKENMFASVTWPFRRRRICLAIHPGVEQTWYMDENGYGFDKKRLMLPVVGKLPESDAPLANDDMIIMQLTYLKNAVIRLNRELGSPIEDLLIELNNSMTGFSNQEEPNEEKPLDWLC